MPTEPENYERLCFIHREVKRLYSEMKSKEGEDRPYATKCADKMYVLYFESSIISAKYISDLEEKLEKENKFPSLPSEEIEWIQKTIEGLRKSFSTINNELKAIQEYQQEHGLTNVPLD